MAIDATRALELAKELVKLLTPEGVAPVTTTLSGLVLGVKYQGGLVPFGEKDQQIIDIFLDSNQRVEQTVFVPGATGPVVLIGKHYKLVLVSAPGRLDELKSVTED